MFNDVDNSHWKLGWEVGYDYCEIFLHFGSLLYFKSSHWAELIVIKLHKFPLKLMMTAIALTWKFLHVVL